MIHYKNVIRFDNLSFEDYLNIPAHSHSFLKREKTGVAESLFRSEAIRMGSLVDAILTDPAKADINDPLYSTAKNIAAEIKLKFGAFIKHFKRQVSYTADICLGNFVMPTKGRLDFLLENIAVIDLKITKSKDIDGLISFMGYENQLWHYSKLAGVSKAYLLIYSIPHRKTFIKHINCNCSNSFWEEKIIIFGRVQEKV